MLIPKIIHQTWKTADVPVRWQSAVDSVKRYHPGWEYRLWTHADMDDYVSRNKPDLWPIFHGFEKDIMRADVFRYVLMHDIGGLYADLDYRFLRPFPYGDAELLLADEFSLSFGDRFEQVASFVFASRAGHPLWKDILVELLKSPPKVNDYTDVVNATGPGFLSRVFFANRAAYQGVVVTPKPALSPVRLHGPLEQKILLNSGICYGMHYGSGTWKERWTATYLKAKVAKILRF